MTDTNPNANAENTNIEIASSNDKSKPDSASGIQKDIENAMKPNFSGISEEERQGVIDALHNDVPWRIWRTISAISIPAITILAYSLSDMTIYNCLGLGMLLHFGLYFLRFFITISRAKYLWRIFSVNSVIHHWAPMSVTAGVKQHRDQSIQSISEFSAIEGAYANRSLISVSETAWFVLVTIVIINVKYGGTFFQHADDYLAVISAYGLLNLGIWDLNPFSNIHKILHYVSVGMGLCSLVAFALQQNWSAVSIIMIVVTLIAAGVWVWRCTVATKYTDGDIAVIHINTLSCLWSEGILFVMAALAFSLWVFLHKNWT